MANGDSPARALAHRSLQRARADLDDVMRTLPAGDDDTMASPVLVGALLRAVAARRYFNDLEAAFEVEAALQGAVARGAPRATARS